ncbi:MAG: amino acid permease [Verrucomicrobia subdivision 3 bacterium]|nr:amino acid permease [Limisphaerales bacterium]
MLNQLLRRKSVERILGESEAGRMEAEHGGSLKRTLRAVDLTAFGIAAIIGAGIFSTVGQAAAAGGPAVSLLFVFIAIACGFTAFCYAEFASMIPISGSAYTYAYASFGELVAWIIGWDLLLEYAIGNIAIAISWSDYFTGFLSGLGIVIPEYMTMDFLTALRGHGVVEALLAKGQTLAQILADQPQLKDAYNAWTNAPVLGPVHFVADVPALFITVSITALIYVGIRESRNAANLMVALKLTVILAVIAIGFFYVDPGNWSPFAPNGLGGVLSGVAAVFWAFIGFDAISTTAEECENPRRDLPRAILYTLIICTTLYVLISFVLTGIVNYKELDVGDPLAHIFKERLPWLSGVIAFSAIFVIASVFLVFQLGQPRIWMSMSRDGLLPRIFSRIHPKYKTPSFSTVVTGFVVAIPALFMNLKEVVDLSSIGTLFAFVLVCGGVLVLENSKNPPARPKFKTPYINGRYIVPLLYLGVVFVTYRYFKAEAWDPFFSMAPRANEASQTESGWDLFKHKVPMILFIAVSTAVVVLSFLKRLSLIPVLGLLSCFYLMTQLGITNWTRFGIWLVAGLLIYFLYSRKSSRLNQA